MISKIHNVEDINYFGKLPTELICQIFSCLTGKEIAIMQMVAPIFNQMVMAPGDPLRLRIKKYFFSLNDGPEGTFEEKCVWAASQMITIEKLLALGLTRINKYLYKANKHVYLYINNGKFVALKSTEVRTKHNHKYRAVVPSSLLNYAKEFPFRSDLLFLKVRSNRCTRIRENSNGILIGKKNRRVTPEEKQKILSGRNSFIEDSYVKLKNCLDPKQEIYLKTPKGINNKIFGVSFKGKKIKLLRSTFNFWKISNEKITGIKELTKRRVVFCMEDGPIESVLELLVVQKSHVMTHECRHRPCIYDKKRKLRNREDLVPLPMVKEKSGFVIGGQNSPELILSIRELAGQTIAALKKNLNNNFCPFCPGESLLKVMASDQRMVDKLSITHQELVLPLFQMSSDYEKRRNKEIFEYNGSKFIVKNCYKSDRRRVSPFGHRVPCVFQFTFKNNTTCEELQINYLIMDSIRRFGFYGSFQSVYRVSPEKIYNFLIKNPLPRSEEGSV